MWAEECEPGGGVVMVEGGGVCGGAGRRGHGGVQRWRWRDDGCLRGRGREGEVGEYGGVSGWWLSTGEVLGCGRVMGEGDGEAVLGVAKKILLSIQVRVQH